MDQAPGIAYVKHTLFGRSDLWAVNVRAPRDGMGEPVHLALFCVAGGSLVYECALGHTALEAKKPMSREEAAAAAPQLVRRAEEDLAAGRAWGTCREPGD